MRKLCTAGCALLLVALVVAPAQADLTFTVGGWSQQFPGEYASYPDDTWTHGADGYPGDTISIAQFTGTLELPDGPVGTQTQVIQQIGTLEWIVDYTAGGETDVWEEWVAQQQDFVMSRNLTIGGASAALDQPGVLVNDPYYDYLGLSDGTTATLIYDTWKIEITPLALPQVQMNNWSGSAPWTQSDRPVMATFTVTKIPAPGAAMLVFVGMGLVGWAKRRLA